MYHYVCIKLVVIRKTASINQSMKPRVRWVNVRHRTAVRGKESRQHVNNTWERGGGHRRERPCVRTWSRRFT